MVRSRARALLAGLVVVGVGVAGTAALPFGGHAQEQAVEAGIDDLHTTRPAAAVDERAAVTPDAAAVAQTALAGAAIEFVAAAERARVAEFVAALEQAAIAEAQASSGSRGSSGGGRGGCGSDLECIKQRESGGDYTVCGGGGGSYCGAYQFHQNTWNSTAADAGRSDLVGMNPAAASPTDQDAMAQHLMGWQGPGQWSTS